MTIVGALEVSVGAGVILDGLEWTVGAFEPQFGNVLLCRPDGQQQQTTVRALFNHSDRRNSPAPGAPASPSRLRQPTVLDDLTAEQADRLRLRVAHLLEAETGFGSGDPRRAAPGEPRPAYDPSTTTLSTRRRAKVAELHALDRQAARMLGVEHVSERTLERLAAAYRRFGVAGCIDGRAVRRCIGHVSVGEEVREAIFAVHTETLHRSRITMKTRERLIHQYVREKFGTEASIPCYSTLRVVWVEWFGSGGARQRYVRSAASVATSKEHVVVHRPGQIVALDTTMLPVKVREHVFGDPVSVQLTLALDVYTHSLVAFRLTLVSDTSVDVAMLLRDVMLPLPLREGWGDDMEWPYPGIPAAVVAEFAGHRVAALPFFAPETITTDHGSVYKNHHLVEVQQTIGANILPARVLRPTDKHAIERAFGAIRSLLFEHLLGYQGVDVADRGTDPEADAALTMAEMEHLIATWVVKIWQNRRLGEHAPSWDPGGEHSPNTLFAMAMRQGGFALQIPAPELYYELLPACHVTIAGNRGVKVRGLWYDGPALDPYRGQPSARGGRHKRKWVVRRDRREPRFVYFQDPAAHQWHTLRWVGLPPDGDIPSFGDASVQVLLRTLAEAGLAPRSDTELLPALLDIIAEHTPVAEWPTQLPKRRRTNRARETTQAAAAARDRPRDSGEPARAPMVSILPPRRDEHVRQVADAVDAERRRRREQAVPTAPKPPPRLGDSYRRRSLVLPDDAEDAPTGSSAPIPETAQ
jgi:hypothetical protein